MLTTSLSQLLEDIINDGEYPWDARSTFMQHNLTAASDYSLMLWTQDPPRQSISGYFSLGPTSSNITSDNEAINDPEKSNSCLTYLRSNGGYYNQTEDEDFNIGVLIAANVSDQNTAYEVENLAVGSTSLSWSSWSAGSNSAFQLKGLPINLIWQTTLGVGIVGLNLLQRARNSRIPEMDVISLNLGTGGNTGSVIMGGYDNALIDHNQKTIFSKTNTGDFEVSLTEITYIGSSEKPVISNSASSGESRIALAYDSHNIQLSPEVLKVLLPLIGSPTFDESLNGYVYSGAPRIDYSLRFTLKNDIGSASIIVPAASLLVTDTSSDNPLTPRIESGRTYLRLSPSSSSHPTYLGRAFLQHVYVINAPPTINKFLISAIPSPFPKTRLPIPASRASISIFSTTPSSDNKPAVGPMVGGILGGLAVIIGVIAAWIWIQRRKRRHMPSRSSGKLTVRFDENKNSSIPSYDHEKNVGFSQNSGGDSKTTTTSMSSFPRDANTFFLPPTSPEPPVKDPELIRRLSQQTAMKRRQSENSTVARVFMGPYSPQVDDIGELKQEMNLQRTATVGKFYSAGRVAKVESPTLRGPERAKTTKSHVRTASIGRICTPTSVEFSPIASRRGSMRTVGSGDGHVKSGSVDSSDKEEMVIKEEEEKNHKGKGKMRWSNSTKTTDTEESDDSSVFGLNAVTKDGSEFLKGTTEKDGGNPDGDPSPPSTIESRNEEDTIPKVGPLVITKN